MNGLPLHDDRPKEECGVVGLYTPSEEAARVAFFALFALQHRGQESAGIAVSDGSQVRMHKDMGLVSQVFNEEILRGLSGSMAVGHTRYSTMGASVLRNAQPIYCQSLVGEIAVAHNGNLINARELRKELQAEGEHFDGSNDSEVIARLLVRSLHLGPEEAVRETMKRLKGAYSVTVLTPQVVLGFRDPYGVRPLIAGRVDDGFLVASESCAFGPVGGTIERELEPGEMVLIDRNGMRFAQGVDAVRRAMCLFEFIYFARPDSRMYGTVLYTARERMGERLALEHPVEADAVVPVPDSGIPAALGYSRQTGIPFVEGMTKSRYIHRTFIQPDQRMRERGVRMKLTPIIEHIAGRRLILVDDSIVRATTTKQIVRLLFEAGASEVHVRITAPPIRFPCFYGIDMASRGELAAAKMTIDEICRHVGATSLGYLSIPGACEAVGRPTDDFCLACFDGEYPLPVPEDLTKQAFEAPPEVGDMETVRTGQLKLMEV
ncbi:MAG TPA: amidophosphoribosyltransferase [Fimbriimonadaceae bacterium]|nr:amidophosphoribosyltransferase [Fimbriimonadaceae bacterium]HRJ96333.1 amidophosphoribosyltransferase [Fimbriimonadaceae bacterium]